MVWNKITDKNASPDEKFYGMYRGQVVNNQDPDKDSKIQIRIYPLFEGVEDSALPWAVPSDPLMGGFGKQGGVIIPQEQAWVWCFFEEGDHRFPVYFGGAPSKGDIPDDAKTNYPNRRLFRSASGIEFYIDDTQGSTKLHISMPNGYVREVDDQGTVTETIPKDMTITVSGNCSFNVTGNIDLTGSGDIDVTASSGTISITGNLVDINN